MENSNSIVNQRIKGDFVRREVMTCFSYEMEEILKKELISYDDIENICHYVCNECGSGYADEVEAKTCCNAGQPESEPQEIFEWWIITEYLYNKLRAKNEPVTEWGNNYYWGRTCTGQAILLDSVISGICRDMEILDGQKYSWNKSEVIK